MNNSFETLNWLVQKEQLFLADGTPTDIFAVVRQDNRDVFTSVKSGYAEFQNHQMLELVKSISSVANMEIHKAGCFQGGRKTYVQLVSPVSIDGIGDNKDKVNFYSTCLNSHDGTTALSWGSTNITISCKNTFHRAVKSMNSSARHTRRSIDEVLNMISLNMPMIDESVLEAERTAETMMAMSKKLVKPRDVEEFIKNIFKVDFAVDTKENTNAKRFNRAEVLKEAIRSEMAQKGNTAWGMFSGLTKFTTHLSSKNADSREANKYSGIYNNMDNVGFKLASQSLI
jgi:hypothetical protein